MTKKQLKQKIDKTKKQIYKKDIKLKHLYEKLIQKGS